jgi:hypothetical protein
VPTRDALDCLLIERLGDARFELAHSRLHVRLQTGHPEIDGAIVRLQECGAYSIWLLLLNVRKWRHCGLAGAFLYSTFLEGLGCAV